MFEKILVPVDLTDKNQIAVEMARRIAREGGGTITLLHVIETLALPFEELREFYDELQEKAEAVMAGLARATTEGELDIDCVVVYGRPAEETLRHADENGVDLIVLHSHKVDPENPGLGWASLSYKMAILAQCPVLLVK